MSKKNVVVILSDQHHYRWSRCYGADWVKTPNIDKIAANGVQFDDVFCSSPLCAPSRASLITGQHPYTHGALYHLLRRNPKVANDVWGLGDVPTVGEIFRNAGYSTACIGKLHVHGETPTHDLGFTERAHRYYTYNFKDYVGEVGEENCRIYSDGFEKTDWVRRRHNTTNSPLPMEQRYMQDELTLSSTENFLERHKEQLFFLLVGLEKPHDPWLVTERFHQMYKPEGMPLPPTRRQSLVENQETYSKIGFKTAETSGLSDEEIANSLAAYAAAISYTDDCVGRILAALESRNLLENTILAYTSDHGELAFEHSRIQKHCFYDGAVRVPLIISFRNELPTGEHCDALASLIDLMPTLCYMNGIQVPDSCEGISLLPHMLGTPTDRHRTLFAEFHRLFPTRMVVNKRFKYCFHAECDDFLFDRKSDPLEIYNLIHHPDYRETSTRMREQALKDWWPLKAYRNGEILPEDECLNDMPEAWFKGD